jgi:type I restriction enzyme, S subunit
MDACKRGNRGMIDRLKPYLERKATGHHWLGDVPRHWSVLPNRVIFSEVKDRNHPDEEMLSVTITRGIVRQRTLLADSSKKDSSNLNRSAYKLVQPRDIAYNKMRAWQGAIGVSDFQGIISPAYVVMRLRNNENLPRYFHHLYRTPQFAKEAERRSYGITSDMWSLRPEHFKLINTLQPPPNEQAMIVRFLDCANGRMERAIQAKWKVIALLNEQKQAIINRAVTRGLDPSIPVKPSGIPWLGDIPQHWEIPRVKQCAIKISKGTTPSTEGREILESGPVRFIKAENISEGQITSKPLFSIDEETNSIIRRSQLRENDILFVIAGATLGKTAVVTKALLPANTNQAVAFIRPNKRIIPKFMELWLQSPRIKELVWLNAVQSAQPNLSMADLGNFVCPVPNQDEQIQILEFVDTVTTPLKETISRLKHEIALLREYRTRLVADVVTGKLDVREAAAKLPDEEIIDETGASDEAEISDEEIAL